jgi:hypothetical protein
LAKLRLGPKTLQALHHTENRHGSQNLEHRDKDQQVLGPCLRHLSMLVAGTLIIALSNCLSAAGRFF